MNTFFLCKFRKKINYFSRDGDLVLTISILLQPATLSIESKQGVTERKSAIYGQIPLRNKKTFSFYPDTRLLIIASNTW